MRATYGHEHELGASITGNTSSSVQPQRHSVSIPSSRSPVKPHTFRENDRVQATHSHERISSTTGSTYSSMQPQRHSVSTPPSISPVKSPSFRDSAQATHSHELGSSTTGSTSSGVQLGRYSVSSPPSSPQVKTSSLRGQRTEAHPSATKTIQNLPSRHRSRANVNRSNNQRYGMEKRSVSTSGFRRFDGKQIPKQ